MLQRNACEDKEVKSENDSERERRKRSKRKRINEMEQRIHESENTIYKFHENSLDNTKKGGEERKGIRMLVHPMLHG